MSSLSSDQKDVKIAYLMQENQQLREQLLDAQILAGDLRLKAKEAAENE